MTDREAFLLQRVQPAMVGLIDGSLSTLAPIFSVAVVTHKPHYAFIAGLATAFGAGISMAFSEGLSDTGEPDVRGLAHDVRLADERLPAGHSSAPAGPPEQDERFGDVEEASCRDGDDPPRRREHEDRQQDRSEEEHPAVPVLRRGRRH